MSLMGGDVVESRVSRESDQRYSPQGCTQRGFSLIFAAGWFVDRVDEPVLVPAPEVSVRPTWQAESA